MTKDISKICVSPLSSIKAMLAQMTAHKPKETMLPAGIALVVDDTRTLKGIVTNGDIRRAMARGTPLSSKVFTIMNNKPFLIVGPKSNTEILSLVLEKARKEQWHQDHLNKLVIVDKAKRAIDVVSLYDLWHQSDVRFKHIGVVGLGYVGLTLALTLADAGFSVQGLDKSRDVTLRLSKGKPHFFEAGMERLLKDHLGKKFFVVNNFSGANNCDIYFITVGTPVGKNNKPDLHPLQDAARKMGKILKHGDIVILRSTVPIGTTRNTVVPILERESGLAAGEGFMVSFAPERTIEGKALEELRTLPQVIGGLNHASSDLASSIFNFITKSTVLVDSLEAAEMVKLVNNTYRDVTFAFSNEISLIAQRWGIDTKKVVEAANYGYERSDIPSPSPGVGGYCLTKDPFILIESARAKKYESKLIRHARMVNEMMVQTIADSVVSFLKTHKANVRNPKIVVLGLAFKGRPQTSDVRGSTSIDFANALRSRGIRNIHGYDPAVKRGDFLAHGFKHAARPERAFEKADAIVVMNNNPHFESLDIRNLLAKSARPAMLLDGWAIFSPEEIAKHTHIHYKRL